MDELGMACCANQEGCDGEEAESEVEHFLRG